VTPEPPHPPTLFFATLAAGGGHVATAKAMAQAVEAGYPGEFGLVVSDFMLELGFLEQDRRHKEGWAWMLGHPWSARWGQRVLDRFPRLTNRYHRLMLDALSQEAARYLNALSPLLVVANHGWLTVALTRARRRYGLLAPVLHFATEPLDASALWAEPDASHLVVPSRGALNDLVRMGVREEKVDLIGYPVQQAFLHAPSKKDARHALGLQDRFTCLVSLGGEGIGGHVEETVGALLSHPLAPQVVVVAGRNEALRRRLEPLGAHALGFVANMADYLAACDVVVGKAGPASVMEALAVGRPLLLTTYAGLNERKLVRFVEAKGLGAYVPRPRGLGEQLARFSSPDVQEEVAARAAHLGLPEMTRALGDYLVTVARQGAPKTRVRLRGLAE